MTGWTARIVLCALIALAPRAHAEPRDSFDASYLYDDGAIPFFWTPLALGIGLSTVVSPREVPFGFSDEGGAAAADWEVPSWVLVGLGAATGAAILAGGDESRYYHLKGISQAMATSMFVTNVGKTLIGRHRPDWTEELSTRDSRRSFPSGHATQAFAVATYSIVFLRGHVLADSSASWQAAAYVAITLGATLFAAERVYHNRHHVSDVVAGGLIGTTSALVFYYYQENQLDSDRVSAPAHSGPMLGWSSVW